MPPSLAGAAQQESNERVAYEVADVLRAYGAEFVRTHTTSALQRRVLRAIASCRTAMLGGHLQACESCGHQRIAYNSCRNRNCPKCLGTQSARWMAAEEAMLLPVPYFHLVFTLPHDLNALVRAGCSGVPRAGGLRRAFFPGPLRGAPSARSAPPHYAPSLAAAPHFAHWQHLLPAPQTRYKPHSAGGTPSVSSGSVQRGLSAIRLQPARLRLPRHIEPDGGKTLIRSAS